MQTAGVILGRSWYADQHDVASAIRLHLIAYPEPNWLADLALIRRSQFLSYEQPAHYERLLAFVYERGGLFLATKLNGVAHDHLQYCIKHMPPSTEKWEEFVERGNGHLIICGIWVCLKTAWLPIALDWIRRTNYNTPSMSANTFMTPYWDDIVLEAIPGNGCIRLILPGPIQLACDLDQGAISFQNIFIAARRRAEQGSPSLAWTQVFITHAVMNSPQTFNMAFGFGGLNEEESLSAVDDICGVGKSMIIDLAFYLPHRTPWPSVIRRLCEWAMAHGMETYEAVAAAMVMHDGASSIEVYDTIVKMMPNHRAVERPVLTHGGRAVLDQLWSARRVAEIDEELSNDIGQDEKPLCASVTERRVALAGIDRVCSLGCWRVRTLALRCFFELDMDLQASLCLRIM